MDIFMCYCYLAEKTTFNTRYTLRRLTAARATKNRSRANALGAVFLRHILRLLVFAAQSP
jgi:hypothetical protein